MSPVGRAGVCVPGSVCTRVCLWVCMHARSVSVDVRRVCVLGGLGCGAGMSRETRGICVFGVGRSGVRARYLPSMPAGVKELKMSMCSLTLVCTCVVKG